MAEYAYVRVSSRDQHEERQLVAMREKGIPKRNIYMDKQSGKDFDRSEYLRLVKWRRKTIFVHRKKMVYKNRLRK